MRQIGIGYRVRTVIIANELFRNNKKKGESNNYEIIMIGKKKKKKKKYFKRRREIFQEANTIFFFLSKRWRNICNGIGRNVVHERVSRLYKWETKCTVIEQSVKTEKGLRDLKKY